MSNTTGSKSILDSRTVRFNAIAALLFALQENFDAVPLPDSWRAIAFSVLVAANLYLRTITTQPVRLPGVRP